MLASIDRAIRDFLSAGIELPSTGQTREDLTRLFLTPDGVDGVAWDGGDVVVTGPVRRKRPLRLREVQYARRRVPRYYGFKEPVTDPYTLARSVRRFTGYGDLRELAFALAREVVAPELRALEAECDYLQLDGPYYWNELPFRDYIPALYAELTAGLRKPLVLHACGDTVRVVEELARLPGVGVLSLDFTHNPRLIDVVAARSFDARIGLGVVNTASPEVESVAAVMRVLTEAVRKIGEERIAFVHPGCGERHLPVDVAYQKNVNLVLARNEVFYGEGVVPTLVAQAAPLREEEYDPSGYFLIQVDPGRPQIVVTQYDYGHRPQRRLRGTSGEKLLHTILAAGILAPGPAAMRHYGYLGYELAKAEAALQHRVPYRQDRPLELPTAR